jgi:uncharacterized membrane protein
VNLQTPVNCALQTGNIKISFPSYQHHTGRNRILSLDPLRGIAMALMILAHSYLNVNEKLLPPALAIFFWFLNYLPAVAFVWISGTVFSYFLYSASDPAKTCRRYAARAAFLILIAHPAINLASLGFTMPVKESSLGYSALLSQLVFGFPITDTIAVSLLLAPFFIRGIAPLKRGLVILLMLFITPLFVAFINPHQLPILLVKEALFGVIGEPRLFWWPLIPWLAIFLTGSFMGQTLALAKQGKLFYDNLVQTMYKTGLVLVLISILLTSGYKLIKVAFMDDWNPNIFAALYPKQTTSLLPCYLGLLYLIFAKLVHRIEIAGNYDRLLWFLSVFGRTALFTFIVQFTVVESVPALLGLRGNIGLTGFLNLFIIGSCVVWLLSFAYGRMRGWVSEHDYAEHVAIARTNALKG